MYNKQGICNKINKNFTDETCVYNCFPLIWNSSFFMQFAFANSNLRYIVKPQTVSLLATYSIVLLCTLKLID